MAGRRGKNEGYIAKRADGRWEARIHLGWKDMLLKCLACDGVLHPVE